LEELGNLVIVRGVDPELFMWFFFVVDDFLLFYRLLFKGGSLRFRTILSELWCSRVTHFIMLKDGISENEVINFLF